MITKMQQSVREILGSSAELVDHSLDRVDGRVGRHQLVRRFLVAGRQSCDGFRNLPLGKLPHFGKHSRENLQVGIEGFGRVSGDHHRKTQIEARCFNLGRSE